MRKNKSSAKPATLPLFALDKTSKASIIRNRKSAADERLALSITQRSWAESLGEGGSLLFMFTITKQFDQRNDDQCQLAQITKGQLELHKRHPSLRVGLRDFFIFKKCSLTRYTEVYLRAEPSTVMAAPEPLSRSFKILPEILLSGKFYIHTEKTGNIAGFPLCINYCIFSSLWINFKSSPFVLRKVFSS